MQFLLSLLEFGKVLYEFFRQKSPLLGSIKFSKLFLFLAFLSSDKFSVIDLKTGNLSLIKLLPIECKNF